MQTLQICDFVHDYYTCALCVYTNAVCPVMHMSVPCPCVCRKRAGLCAAVLHGPCYLFLVPSDYSLILFYFTGTHCLFYCSVALFPPVLSPCPSSVVLRLFSALLTSSLPPPSLYHSAPDWLHLPPPQGGPTAAVTGHCCCRTGGTQASTPHHYKVCGRGQPCQALTNMLHCRDVHQ